jgi:hypothetical protein
LIPSSISADRQTPIIDLLTISGYALIFSELHASPVVWNTTRTLWDAWLAENTQRLEIIDAMVSVDKGTFAIQPRAILRTQWEMQLRSVLEALPRKEARSPWDEGPLDHQSALIRALTPVGQLFLPYNALDTFIALYLQERPDAKKLTFGIRGSYVGHLEFLRERVQHPEDGDDE